MRKFFMKRCVSNECQGEKPFQLCIGHVGMAIAVIYIVVMQLMY